MDLLSVKLKIGDREYPMKVKPDEEERVRNAGKFINDQLKSYREKFGIDDKEDLLAMVAFDCVVAKLKSDESHSAVDDTTDDKIDSLNKLVKEALS
ncbi:cell division protein ZapA [Roseivirga sp.]|uniref:cell division protein ZapA n=1 Tax=Roseivirga sp. TaxID=1964215 RepID=UPI003B8CE4A9